MEIQMFYSMICIYNTAFHFLCRLKLQLNIHLSIFKSEYCLHGPNLLNLFLDML